MKTKAKAKKSKPKRTKDCHLCGATEAVHSRSLLPDGWVFGHLDAEGMVYPICGACQSEEAEEVK